MAEKRNTAIDAYKFLLALVVAFLHFDYLLIPLGYLAVESFFFIDGMFFAKKLQRDQSLDSSFFKQIGRIYLPYAVIVVVSVLVESILYPQSKRYLALLPSLLFLQPYYMIELESTFQLWYIGALLFATMFFAIFERRNKGALLPEILVAFLALSYIVYYSPSKGINYSNSLFGGIPFGFVRGLFDFALGVIGMNVLQYLKQKFDNTQIIFVNFIQVVTFFSCCMIYFAPIDVIYDLPYLILNGIFILTLNNSDTVIYRLLSYVPESISCFSRYIYFVHGLVLTVVCYFNIKNIVIYLCATCVCAVALRFICDSCYKKGK